MRIRRLIAPAFFVSLVSSLCVETAFAQPPAVPGAGGPADPAPGAGKDVPATSPAISPEPTQVQPAVVAPAGQPQVDSNKGVAAEFTSLRLMRAKGVISEAEYESAMRDLGESTGMRAADGNTFVLGKWATTMYGFIEGDTIYDTTQGLNEIAGNSQIPKHGTYAGDKDRMQFSVRNSRLGFRLKAPETSGGVRASAQLEMDFFGGANPASGAEATVFNNAVLRIRHANFKVETPFVDFLVGQYWTLLGWHAGYLPATVEIQGVPAGVFSRQMQVQISKTVKTDAITFEAAIAALRPPARDGALPAGQGGLRLAANKWTAPQTANFTGTSIQPLSIAVTGDVRSYRIPDLASPLTTQSKVGGVLAVDAFIPVIPGTKESRGNSLALNGEFTTGAGGGDMFTGLTGGVALPGVVAPATTAPDLHVDAGQVGYDPQAVLHLTQWTTFVAGIQYYLPGSGNVFLSANYSRSQSGNTAALGALARTRNAEDWFDFNLFWDATSAVRVGVEYANFHDSYNDGSHAINQRVQASGAFLF